jgi:ubiquinone/menaquinone biosynthesis C-methylase UbiE
VVARLAAERAGSAGRVAGLDLNPGMLAVARSFASVGGLRLEWYEGNALALPFDTGEFGVVLCQFGLQFFPDPLAALRQMRRVLVAGGKVGVSVFAEIERNPVAHALCDALDRHAGAGASAAKRSEHALADRAALRSLLRHAGFTRPQIETLAKTSRYPSLSAYVDFQLQATPLAAILDPNDRPGSDRLAAAVVDALDARVGAFVDERGFAFPQTAHVASASA